MTQCLIALGGNINASEAVFHEAMQRLERPGLVVEQLSRPFVTRPVGSAAGEEYVNAAAVLECSLAPMSLLKTLHEVDAALKKKDNAQARALAKEARDLIAAMPITAAQAASPEIKSAFTGGKEKSSRQAELEQQWAAFAKEKYTAAKAKADEALKLAR